MADAFELLWAHTEDRKHYELCCIPFFIYGFALGDTLTWDENPHQADS